MNSVFGDIRQIAYVSDDLARSLAYFTGTLGIGPWFVKSDFRIPECRDRGLETEVVVDAALASAGTLQLEVIVQKSPAPTLYSEFLAQFGATHLPHSWCAWPEDYDATLKAARARGFRPVLEARPGLGRIAYLEHPAQPHFAYELAEYTPERRSIFAQIRAAAEGWDGTDPIRDAWPAPQPEGPTG